MSHNSQNKNIQINQSQKDHNTSSNQTPQGICEQEKSQDIETLKKELENYKKKVEEYLNGWKRARADYLNLKRESEREKEEMIKFANAALILEIIPIYNHFKRAWQHLPEDLKENSWVKGIEQIKRQFQNLLKAMGIEEIKTIGEHFNPELHEAVAKEKITQSKSGSGPKEIKPGDIIEEISPGYKMHDKVIIHAKVKVAE